MKPFTAILLFSLCFAVIAAVILFFYLRSRKKADPISPPAPRTAQLQDELSDFSIKFSEKLERFRKDMLAYHLERLAWKNHLSLETLERNREKYGKVLLQPSFFIYEELSQHNLSEDDLENVERKWLQEHGYPVPNGNLKAGIEHRVSEEVHKEAIEITASVMPDGEKVVDFQ